MRYIIETELVGGMFAGMRNREVSEVPLIVGSVYPACVGRGKWLILSCTEIKP